MPHLGCRLWSLLNQSTTSCEGCIQGRAGGTCRQFRQGELRGPCASRHIGHAGSGTQGTLVRGIGGAGGTGFGFGGAEGLAQPSSSAWIWFCTVMASTKSFRRCRATRDGSKRQSKAMQAKLATTSSETPVVMRSPTPKPFLGACRFFTFLVLHSVTYLYKKATSD